MRTLLVDSDVFLYAASSATETEVDWGDGLWTLHGYLDEAIAAFDEKMQSIMKKLEGDKLLLALTDTTNWRHGVLPTYKGKRKDKRKPIVLKPLRDYAIQKYDTYIRPGLEADDILGILATLPSKEAGVEKIVVTIDKDLGTIPGRHFNTNKPDLGVYEVGQGQADYFHLKQALMGDQTDGYAGCPGIGPKTADKILLPFTDETKHDSTFDVAAAWVAVVKAYEKAGLNETVALQMARVARICRSSDYNMKTKEVILWTPPKV